eukprot:GHVT01064781.1.p1 GENE.GHVT01064781.1~~GHVT01064781.1.p1  ORF type:complete len:130 (+),score=7.72 GHVT01064781.1:604-993(+)
MSVVKEVARRATAALPRISVSAPKYVPATLINYPPVHGGPVYWTIRNRFATGKPVSYAAKNSWLMNVDWHRALLAGTPKCSFDPTANQWMWNIDNEEWNGVGGRVYLHFHTEFHFWFLWALAIYTVYWR